MQLILRVIDAKFGSALPTFRTLLPFCDGVPLATAWALIVSRELPVPRGFHNKAHILTSASNWKEFRSIPD